MKNINYNRLNSTYTDFDRVEKFMECQRVVCDSKLGGFTIHAAYVEFAALTHTVFHLIDPTKTCFNICNCEEDILKTFDVDSLIEAVLKEIKDWYEWGVFRIVNKCGCFKDGDPCRFTFYSLKERNFSDNKGNVFVIQGYLIDAVTDDNGNTEYYKLFLDLTPYKYRVYNTTHIYCNGKKNECIEEIQRK